MPDASEVENQPLKADDLADQVLHLVRELVLELHSERSQTLRVGLDSSLDRDLGLDSLGRAELLLRLERTFRIRLAEASLNEAESPRDLLTAVLQAEEGGANVDLTKIDRPVLEAAEPAPLEAQTLIEVLDWHVEAHGERPTLLLWDEPEGANVMTYAQLAEGAKAVARGLIHWGLEPGDRAAIMLPTGPEFFKAFLGIMYAGGVPVPIYPPVRLSQLEDHMRRQTAILDNAEAAILVTVREARHVAAYLKSRLRSLRGIETVDRLHSFDDTELPAPPHPENLAFLQYTSGSTGDPNGVMLSHNNLLANIRAFGHAFDAGPSDVFVSWLPLYHDLGLIAGWLGSMYFAAPMVIMSPVTFLTRPEQWLWAIHKHRGTISAAPNFAFELAVRKIKDADMEGLDLSSLRGMMNGAEPIVPATLTKFADKFSKFGFRPEAMTPAYGLAENTVGLSIPPVAEPTRIDRVERKRFVASGEAVPAADGDDTAMEFVCCGRPFIGHEVRVVDAGSREVSDRQQGRLQFRGPSATKGFFRNPEKTAQLYDGDWLNTGDMAYIAGGEIYITGRSKDLIIRAGRNIHPYEVEAAVGALEGVRKGCVAVFGTTDAESGTEKIVVLAETREPQGEAQDELRERIRKTTTEILESPPDDIVLAPPHSVPKTSSGKIRRNSARELYETGQLGKARGALWWQLTRMAAVALASRVRHSLANALDFAYAGYWWLVLAAVVVVAWVVVVALPRPSWRWAVLHRAARAIMRLHGVAIEVTGLDNLPAGGAVIVANHSSYYDAVVLVATLPGEISFVAKKEFESQFVAGNLLGRVGTVFVERFDAEASVEDTGRALDAVRDGRRLMLFPEGTITRMPGLLGFRMGAFQVAMETAAPVVPITLQGTRSILRDGQWFPRRGRIVMTVGAPISADGTDFTAAIRLRDATRREILANCGEPDLARERVVFSKTGVEHLSEGGP